MKKDNPFFLNDQDDSIGQLSGKYKDAWVEEAFDVEEDPSRRLSIAHTGSYIGTSIGLSRIKVFFAVMMLGIAIITGRVVYLQIIKGNLYRSLAENNRIRLVPIPAERGIIYDRFNHQLVQNVPSFSLAIVPEDLPRDSGERAAILAQVAKISGLSLDDLNAQLEKSSPYSYQSIVVKEDLDYQTALSLYIQNANLPGVEIDSGSERSYAVQSSVGSSTPVLSLSPILGYLGKLNDTELASLSNQGYQTSDKIGKEGVEKTYEPILRGTPGTEKIEVNALGKEQDVLATEAPVPGKNLVLTIDADAQKEMENLIIASSQKTGFHKYAAIAMNPSNGEIIAMVSWPTYDDNAFAHGIDQKTYSSYLNNPDDPLLDRAISGTFAPGSTVKLMIAAAGLQEKVITPNTTVDSVGGVDIGNRIFHDWKVGGSGVTNVTWALAWSVNTFFYYVGGGYQNFTGLGVDRIVAYLKSFGLGQTTGIDLPSEAAGFVPSQAWKQQTTGQPWYQGDTYNLSIGQGDLLVTPLQDALWTATIANGGTIVTPHVGMKITDGNGNTVQTLTYPSRKDTKVDLANIEVVQQGLRGCVIYGSCQLLKQLPFTSAGKTGTAQIGDTSQAWFTSYAPFENPQIVVTILVERGGEGSTVAMPIAEQFLAWWGKKYLHQ